MIGILNYGTGNIKAFVNIFKSLNVQFDIIQDFKQLKTIDKLILPGVGSFDSVMSKLEESNLIDELTNFVFNFQKPVLGVCVGMQILANQSEEGTKKGLGWIKGKVKKFTFLNSSTKLVIPQIGWNEVIPINNSSGIFNSLEENPHFYFLHSYFFDCEDNINKVAVTNYGINFCSAVQKDNIFGMQFHPEKSHQNGLQLLKNFSKI